MCIRIFGHRYIDNATALGLDLGNQGRQPVHGPGSEHQVDVRHAFQNLIPFLLGDTSSNPDNQSRLLLFKTRKPPQKTERFLFCFSPDSARIEQNQICFFQFCRLLIAGFGKSHRHLFGVIDIHLTSNGADVEVFFQHGLISNKSDSTTFEELVLGPPGSRHQSTIIEELRDSEIEELRDSKIKKNNR